MKIDHCVFFWYYDTNKQYKDILNDGRHITRKKKKRKKDMNDKTNRFFMENKKKPNKQICESKT